VNEMRALKGWRTERGKALASAANSSKPFVGASSMLWLSTSRQRTDSSATQRWRLTRSAALIGIVGELTGCRRRPCATGVWL